MRDSEHAVWVVVQVAAGVPVSVAGFPTYGQARNCEKRLRLRIHPENDEVGIFRMPLPQSVAQARAAS